MDQEVKVVASEAEVLSVIPTTHIVRTEDQLPQLPPDLIHHCTCVPTPL